MSRTARMATLMALAAATLSACGGVPTSGPIRQGPVVAAAGSNQFIGVIARPPVDGMSPEAIVQGFQEATASADPGYTVARAYLTGAAASTWDPTAGVEIYDSNGLTTSVKGGAVAESGVLTATIDTTGEYAVAPPATKRVWNYALSKVEGQWRIASLPHGLVLSPGDIDRSYRTFDLYFWTTDLSTLVPAPITIPVAESGAATQLVRALLAGPTPWIAPAVRTGFPEATRLAVDAVPVVDGVAQVALSREVLNTDDMARQELSAQLTWTLRQLPDVTGVQITVNGQSLPVAGSGAVQPIDSWPSADPNALSDRASAYALAKGTIVKLSPDGASTPVTKVRPAIQLPAVSLDLSRLAGIAEDGATLYSGKLADGQLAPVFTGSDLSRPSWDSAGNVWVADRGRGVVVVRGTRATRIQISDAGKGFDPLGITALSVSRDGTRLAMLVRRGSVVEPWVARIERSSGIAVAAPRRVTTQVVEAVDLAWLDADTLAVLGSTGETPLDLIEVRLGSARLGTTVTPGSGLVTVAAAPDRPVLLGDGTSTWRATSPSWTVVPNATDAVYPG
jgi:hypothetical protein